MGCQYFAPTDTGAQSMTVAMPKLSFGRGTLAEVGPQAKALGLNNVALFTDQQLNGGALSETVTASLTEAGVQYVIYDDIRIEPCGDSVMLAGKFLQQGGFDGVVSLGGGSVIDTAKGALLLQAQGGDINDYFASPVGAGKTLDVPVLSHIACPTTSGTGSECTSISVIRVNALDCKFVIASPALLPKIAIVDPTCCDSLPSNVVASTGFDLCCHALECYTARAYTEHAHVPNPASRQFIQGANPFSDLAAREALAITGEYLIRGVNDSNDFEARDQLMWGATLAGIAFGNSGTHLPHAMSYGITHLMNNISTEGYAVKSPFIPHGISVVVNAPSIFEYTAAATPERHLEAAGFMGADNQGAGNDDAGEVLSKRLIELMRCTHMPNGLSELGFGVDQVSELAASSIRQKRAIANAPRESNLQDMEIIYADAMSYW